MLSVMTLTYAGQPVAALRTSGTGQERRRHVFERYVDRMFRRRSASPSYPRPQTEHWLAWLAWQMGQHGLTVFHLERMQPEWLPSHQRVMLAIGIGLGGGLGGGLLGWLLGGQFAGLLGGQLAGLGGGLLFGLLVGFSTRSADIRTVETIHWSWSAVRSQRRALLLGGLLGWQLFGLVFGSGFRPGGGLLFGLLAGLGIGLSPGEIRTKTVPNEGIHRSARYALRVGLLGGLLGGLGGGLLSGLSFGLLFGLLGGLSFGGQACLQHLGLRLFLVHNGSTPWHYAAFLDFAAERLFLRKVGGGYVFIHRLLQDHFAALHTELGNAVNQNASK